MMKTGSVRFMGAGEVLAAMTPRRAIDAVERAFLAMARGEVHAPKSVGEAVPDGTFHAKICAGSGGELAGLFVAKVNANFPDNLARHGLPTIQGAILAFDTGCGRLLAVIDSGSVTNLRTAATTAVALRYLARVESKVATIVGCGAQGDFHLRLLAHVLPIEKVYLHDTDPARARALAMRAAQMPFEVVPIGDFAEGTLGSDVVVTCTSSRTPFLEAHHVANGTCIAAVGADNEQKAEIAASLLEVARIVTDQTDQCRKTGDLRRLPGRGASSELREISAVVANGPARVQAEEIVLFDSTGLAVEDLALVAELIR